MKILKLACLTFSIALSILQMTSCSEVRNKNEKQLSDLHDYGASKSVSSANKNSKKKDAVLKASKNSLDKSFCDILIALPNNKSQKETKKVLAQLDTFFIDHPNFDVNCGCSHGTSVKKLGALIPIFKHFVRNKYRSGKDYVYLPIHFAAAKGSDQVVSLLLEKGSKLNVKDSKGQYPLEYGTHKLKISVLEEMINKGAKTDDICLCGIDDLDKIKQMTAIGFDSSGVDISGGFGTFMTDKNLDDYLAYNPDLSKCTINFFFASDRNDKTLRKLIKHGLTPFSESQDGFNRLVLHEFLDKGSVKDETIVLLLDNLQPENKDLVNEPLNNNEYLLHIAIENGYFKTVKRLLELGADKEIINGDNQNAMNFASGNPKMEELLR